MPRLAESANASAQMQTKTTTNNAMTVASIDVQVNRYNRYGNWSLLDDMEETTTTIRHHNRVQRGQMTVKWDKRWVVFILVGVCLL